MNTSKIWWFYLLKWLWNRSYLQNISILCHKTFKTINKIINGLTENIYNAKYFHDFELRGDITNLAHTLYKNSNEQLFQTLKIVVCQYFLLITFTTFKSFLSFTFEIISKLQKIYRNNTNNSYIVFMKIY